MIQRSRAELPVELLGSEATEVTDGVGPQVEDVVPGESLPLLQHHHLSPEQRQFDGRPQPARPGAQNQTLKKTREDGDRCYINIMKYINIYCDDQLELD